MDNKEKMEIFKKLLKQYAKAYKEGLINISTSHLHVDNLTFDEFFGSGKVEVKKEIVVEYLQKKAVKDGITFISLYPLKDFINVNELGEKF